LRAGPSGRVLLVGRSSGGLCSRSSRRPLGFAVKAGKRVGERSLLQSSFLTLALPVSTSSLSPSFAILVATFKPTMHGIFNSLLTMAAWHVNPPTSVMIAAAFFMAGTMLGVVAEETRISPYSILAMSSGEFIILAFPMALPGHATAPLSS